MFVALVILQNFIEADRFQMLIEIVNYFFLNFYCHGWSCQYLIDINSHSDNQICLCSKALYNCTSYIAAWLSSLPEMANVEQPNHTGENTAGSCAGSWDQRY